MSGKLKIKVAIADRNYPLTINRQEEETVRRAAANVNDLIADIKARYQVKDAQDAISMCALQVSVHGEKAINERELVESQVSDALAKIERSLDDLLKLG